MEEQTESEVIYAFPRSKDEKIQFTLSKYRGKRYVDLRLWFKGKENDEFYPTKKGISIPLDQIGQVRKGFEQVSKHLEKSRNREVAVLS